MAEEREIAEHLVRAILEKCAGASPDSQERPSKGTLVEVPASLHSCATVSVKISMADDRGEPQPREYFYVDPPAPTCTPPLFFCTQGVPPPFPSLHRTPLSPGGESTASGLEPRGTRDYCSDGVAEWPLDRPSSNTPASLNLDASSRSSADSQ